MPKDTVGRLVRRGDWRPVTGNVLLIDATAVEPEDWPARARQRAQVAALVGGDHAVLVGLAALSWLGVQGAPLNYEPEYALNRGGTRRRRPGVRERRLAPRDPVPGHPKVVRRDGVPAAGPLWALQQALSDSSGGLSREHAVALVDSALCTGLLQPSDVPVLEGLLVGARRAPEVRRWLLMVDGRAESPLETRARLVCVDGGVPPDDLQRVVTDELGRFVARCDLVWDLGGGRLLIIEMDGAHHRRPGQIRRDNARDSALAALGHSVHHLTWAQVHDGTLLAIVRSAFAHR